MTHGGKRENSGKKKGSKASHTLQALALKEALIKKYQENAKEINQALIEKAKAGDIAAIKELHDRVYGKSPQSLDLGNSDGSLKTIIIQKAK